MIFPDASSGSAEEDSGHGDGRGEDGFIEELRGLIA